MHTDSDGSIFCVTVFLNIIYRLFYNRNKGIFNRIWERSFDIIFQGYFRCVYPIDNLPKGYFLSQLRRRVNRGRLCEHLS